MAERDSSLAFWQTFRTAAIADDTAALIRLSHFPIGMPAFQHQIRNAKQFRARYSDLFNEQCDAKECFKDAAPHILSARRFEIWCPMKSGNTLGDTVVVYHFDHLKKGWRFTGLDNINE